IFISHPEAAESRVCNVQLSQQGSRPHHFRLEILPPTGLCCSVMGISRREMLKRVGVTIGVAAGLRISPRLLVHAQARSQGIAALADTLVSLTPAEAETLRAIVGRL